MSGEFKEKHVHIPWVKLSYIGYVDDDLFCGRGECIEIEVKRINGKNLRVNDERQELKTGSGRPAWEAEYIDIETSIGHRILLVAELQEGLYTVYRCQHFNGTYFVKESYKINSHGVSSQQGTFRGVEKGIPWGSSLKGENFRDILSQRAFVVTNPTNRGGCSPHGFVDSGIEPNNPEVVGTFEDASAHCQNFISALGSSQNSNNIPNIQPPATQKAVSYGSYDDIIDMLGNEQSYRFTSSFTNDWEWIRPITYESLESISRTFLTDDDNGYSFYNTEMARILSKLKELGVRVYMVKYLTEPDNWIHAGSYQTDSTNTAHFIFLSEAMLRLQTSDNWDVFINGSTWKGYLDLDNSNNAKHFVGPRHENGWLWHYYFKKVAVSVAQNYLAGWDNTTFGFFSKLKDSNTLNNYHVVPIPGIRKIRFPEFVTWREAFQRSGDQMLQEGITGLASYGIKNDLDAAKWSDRDAHYIANTSSYVVPPNNKTYAQQMVPLEKTIEKWETDYFAASGQVMEVFNIADMAQGGHNSSGVEGWVTDWGVRLDTPDVGSRTRYSILDYKIYPKEGLNCAYIDPDNLVSSWFTNQCNIDNS